MRHIAVGALAMVGLPLVPIFAQHAPASQHDSAARVLVEPDYLVSRDGDAPHVEIMAAANPRDRRNLIAGSITYTRPEGGTATTVYTSHDGGVSWTDIAFPEVREYGGGDPQVTFSSSGTALFATLVSKPDENGRTRAFLYAYRSEDGGRTWNEPFDLGSSYDHPMLAADHTTGRFAGRLYMSVLYGREYTLGVFRSEDDGRSWIGPVKFIDGAGKRGLNVDRTLVLSDGALVVPFIEFPSTPAQQATMKQSHVYTVISTDGGVTFSKPRPGPGPLTNLPRENPDARLGGFFTYAVDTSAHFRDRLYAVWTDFASGAPRVVVATSTDCGATWRAPKDVATAPASTRQFQPAVAVNGDGVVGVTWYDTRGTSGELAFNEYFAASFDGGATFTDPVRVSSAVSHPQGSGNLTPDAVTFSGPAGEMRIAFVSAANRWLAGGDYMGLTADVAGDFHPVWADARTGSYQLHTARVRIASDARTAAAGAVGAPVPVVHLGAPTDITHRINLVTDPGHYDAATRELDLWIRVMNVSNQPIHGPIQLEIRKFGSGMGDVDAEYAPEILSSSNEKAGAGAVFTYDTELGSSGVLEPQGVSGSKLWRLRLKDPEHIPNFHVFATGRLEQ